MTDRELLEAAAKAAGLPNMRIEAGGAVRYSYAPEHGFVSWNPLTDSGDALRLAVKLRMSIHITDQSSLDDGEAPFSSAITVCPFTDERVPHGDAPYAATRRAIVRAAAAISKEMK